MPRYSYQCTKCNKITTVFHGINEVYLNCDDCSSIQCMEKILSIPTIKKQTTKNTKKVGDLTKEYIETNRKILEEEKQKRELDDAS